MNVTVAMGTEQNKAALFGRYQQKYFSKIKCFKKATWGSAQSNGDDVPLLFDLAILNPFLSHSKWLHRNSREKRELNRSCDQTNNKTTHCFWMQSESTGLLAPFSRSLEEMEDSSRSQWAWGGGRTSSWTVSTRTTPGFTSRGARWYTTRCSSSFRRWGLWTVK